MIFYLTNFLIYCHLGYGGISATTDLSKMVALVYASFGIPIMLLYLSTAGETLSKWLSNCVAKITECIVRSKRSKRNGTSNGNSHLENNEIKLQYNEHGKPNNQCIVSITICLLVLILYVATGTVLMKQLQSPHWSTIDALYFCFTTLSTIGYGELAPEKPMVQYICSIYILLGMAIVAMCFSLIQYELILWLRKVGNNTMEHDDIHDEALLAHQLLTMKSWQKPIQLDNYSYNSLPRRLTKLKPDNPFNRDSPSRRSATLISKQSEYFVPRSVSEFNLSGVGDLALTTQKRKEKMVTFEDETCHHFANKYDNDVFM